MKPCIVIRCLSVSSGIRFLSCGVKPVEQVLTSLIICIDGRRLCGVAVHQDAWSSVHVANILIKEMLLVCAASLNLNLNIGFNEQVRKFMINGRTQPCGHGIAFFLSQTRHDMVRYPIIDLSSNLNKDSHRNCLSHAVFRGTYKLFPAHCIPIRVHSFMLEIHFPVCFWEGGGNRRTWRNLYRHGENMQNSSDIKCSSGSQNTTHCTTSMPPIPPASSI